MALLLEKILIADESVDSAQLFEEINKILRPLKSDPFALRLFLGYFFLGSLLNLDSRNFLSKFGITRVYVELGKTSLSPTPVFHVSFFQTLGNQTRFIVKSIVLNAPDVKTFLSFDVLCPGLNFHYHRTESINEPFDIKFCTIEVTNKNRLTQVDRQNYYPYEKVRSLCSQFKPLKKYTVSRKFSFLTNVQRLAFSKIPFFGGEGKQKFKQSIEALAEVIVSSLAMLQYFIERATFGHQLIRTAYVFGVILSLVPLPSEFGHIELIHQLPNDDVQVLVHFSHNQLHKTPLDTPVLISVDPKPYCTELYLTNVFLNATTNEVLLLSVYNNENSSSNFSVEYWLISSAILKTLYEFRFYKKECRDFNTSMFALQLLQANMRKFQLENIHDVVSHVLGEVCFLVTNFKILTRVFEYSDITRDMTSIFVYDPIRGWLSVTYAPIETFKYIDSKFLTCRKQKTKPSMVSIFAFFSKNEVKRISLKCVLMKELDDYLRGDFKRVGCEKVALKHARRDYDYDRRAILEVVHDFDEGRYSLPKATMSYMSNYASMTILQNVSNDYVRFATVYNEPFGSNVIVATIESLSTEPINLYYDSTMNYFQNVDSKLCQISSLAYLTVVSNHFGAKQALVQYDHSLHRIKCAKNVTTINDVTGICAKIHFKQELNTSKACQQINRGSRLCQSSEEVNSVNLPSSLCNVPLTSVLSSFLIFVQSIIVNAEIMGLITNKNLKATPQILSKTLNNLVSSSKHHKVDNGFFDLILHMIPDSILDAGNLITLYYIAFNILQTFSFGSSERGLSMYSEVMTDLFVNSAQLASDLTHYFTVINADNFRADKVDVTDALQLNDPLYFVNISGEMNEMLMAAVEAKLKNEIDDLDDIFLAYAGMKLLETTLRLGAYIYPTLNATWAGFKENSTFQVSNVVNNTCRQLPLTEFIDIGLVTCLGVKRKNVLRREPDFSGWEDWQYNVHAFIEMVLDGNISARFADKIVKGHTWYTCDNSISLLKHPYITNPPQIECGQMGAAFVDLRDELDIVTGFHTEINVFLVGNGLKFFEGGICDDLFILSGEDTKGILDGGGGKDTLDVSLFAPDCLTINLTLPRMEYCNKIINLKEIEQFILRDNQVDVVIANCEIEGIETGGGKSGTTVRFPALSCIYKVKLIVKGYTFVENNALHGDFVYEIKKSVVNCQFILTRASSSISQRFVVDSDFLTTKISCNLAEKMILIQTKLNTIRIDVNYFTSFDLNFNDFSIRFKYPNFYGEWERRYTEFDVLFDQLYYQVLVLKRISLIIASHEEKLVHILPYKSVVRQVKNVHISEILTILPHKTYETVIHLPLSDSLVVLNHKPRFQTIDEAILPDVTIKLSKEASMFDHTLVLKYYIEVLYRSLNLSPDISFQKSINGSLVISLSTQKVKLVNVHLNIADHRQLDNFRIAKNALLKFDTKGCNVSIALTPVPLYFNSDTKFVIISANDIEENGTITLDFDFGEDNMHFLKYSPHLVVANLEKSLDDMRAIVLWTFFRRKVFATLTMNFRNRSVSLHDFMDNQADLDMLYFDHVDNARWVSPFCKSKNFGHSVQFCEL